MYRTALPSTPRRPRSRPACQFDPNEGESQRGGRCPPILPEAQPPVMRGSLTPYRLAVYPALGHRSHPVGELQSAYLA